MEYFVFGIFIASFFLGIKHSLDIDHVAAVSTLLLRSQSIRRTIKMAIFWAVGHTLTAGIVTIILFLMKDVFLSSFLAGFELLISVMLILIGAITILLETNYLTNIKNKPYHIHIFKKTRSINHLNGQIEDIKDDPINSNPKPYLRLNNNFLAITLIGVLQGLASNDELLILLAFTLGLNSLLLVLVGIVVFSLGVMVGMIAWSSLINLPKIKGSQKKIIKLLNISIAIIAILYGVYILLGGEGINLIAFLG
jgi:high-affinity nickel permease